MMKKIVIAFGIVLAAGGILIYQKQKITPPAQEQFLQTEALPEQTAQEIEIETVQEINIPKRNTLEIPAIINEPSPSAPSAEPSQKIPTSAEIAEFSNWAKDRGITLQAVSATVDDIYYNHYEPKLHNISLENIPGLMLAYNALKDVPGGVLAVMKDKTIYFSTANVRPYTNLTGDYGGTLKNTNPGFILTQPISGEGTAHELGHIVGYHGIEGLYGFAAPFADLKEEYDILFDTTSIDYPPPETPKGYISIYATANKAENFAEHFAYYASRTDDFKIKMAEDDLLIKKYNFFDSKLYKY